MRVDIWSDISCPWCYLAQAHFQEALTDFGHPGEIEVVHRSFELDPTLRKGDAAPIVQVLVAKAGMSEAQAQANEANLARKTAAAGLPYVMGRDHGSTFDMHRMLQSAKRQGRQHELLTILYRANFAEQRSVFDDDERLYELAIEAGLDSDEARAVLNDPQLYAEDVRADEREASTLGAHAVPYFLFDGKYALSGAQPARSFTQALTKAWGDRTVLLLSGEDGADACGPSGCPVPHL